MVKEFHGVIVPTVTLFRPDWAIDWEANAYHIDRLLEAGVQGLFVLGSTGEFIHLTPEEREIFTRWAVEQVNHRVPLFVGVGDCSTEQASHYARVARDAGADAIVILGPYYWSPGEAHLREYFRVVAEAGELPAFIYNYPSVTGYSLSVELIRSLAESCKNIVGVKDTTDSIGHLREMIEEIKRERPDFLVFCGNDDLFLLNLALGGDGCVAGSANFAPEIAVALYNAYRQGDYEKALSEAKRWAALLGMYRLDAYFPTIVKEAMHLRGWGPEIVVRSPALPLPPQAREKVREYLSRAGLI
jgi:4-hydroxy-tetrahydrodipicolinate synthase